MFLQSTLETVVERFLPFPTAMEGLAVAFAGARTTTLSTASGLKSMRDTTSPTKLPSAAGCFGGKSQI